MGDKSRLHRHIICSARDRFMQKYILFVFRVNIVSLCVALCVFCREERGEKGGKKEFGRVLPSGLPVASYLIYALLPFTPISYTNLDNRHRIRKAYHDSVKRHRKKSLSTRFVIALKASLRIPRQSFSSVF